MMLIEERINAFLDPEFSVQLRVFQKIPSTNEALFRDAQKGAPEFTVYVADHQSAGRGRLNRGWESPAGVGLYFSILLRPEINYHYINLINLYTAYALSVFLEREIYTGVEKKIRIDLKWPNDLHIDGRKLAGILLKANFNGSRFQFLVAGIGLNVNQEEVDFSRNIRNNATSLFLATGKKWDREKLLGRFLKFYFENYRHFFPANFYQVPELYGQKMKLISDPVCIRTGSEDLTGIIESISPEGYLVLNCGGKKRTVSTGDVFPFEMEIKR